jgi:hypothetical protein
MNTNLTCCSRAIDIIRDHEQTIGVHSNNNTSNTSPGNHTTRSNLHPTQTVSEHNATRFSEFQFSFSLLIVYFVDHERVHLDTTIPPPCNHATPTNWHATQTVAGYNASRFGEFRF